MSTRSITFLSTAVIILFVACNENGNKKEGDGPAPGETIVQDTIKKSIPAEVSKTIGNTIFKINYHSPGVKGRVIWGGLVPYGQVWVTGAHMATSLAISSDCEISGKTITAGKYALFTIPGKDEWVVIINKNWNQHLADEYDIKDDIARINVKPGSLDQHVERLKYNIEQSGNSEAVISMSWEKVKISFGVKIL